MDLGPVTTPTAAMTPGTAGAQGRGEPRQATTARPAADRVRITAGAHFSETGLDGGETGASGQLERRTKLELPLAGRRVASSGESPVPEIPTDSKRCHAP